jgi:hypothetical protein
MLAVLPYLTRNLLESGLIDSLKIGITFVGFPGTIVNIILAGNVHAGRLWIVNTINVIFYSVLTYRVLTAIAKRT